MSAPCRSHPWHDGRVPRWAACSCLGLLLFAAVGRILAADSNVTKVLRTAVAPSGANRAGFTAMTPGQTGIGFTNRMPFERGLTNAILLNGAGVTVGDVDGDGLPDIFFAASGPACALYRNRGSWRFDDITAPAGVACAEQVSAGAAFADIDGDGDLDLLVTGLTRGVRLFVNDGRGRFTETTRDAGLESRSSATSLAVADIDGDGDLDLYVVNYRAIMMSDEPEKRFKIKVNNGVYELQGVDGLPATAPEVAGRFTVDANSGVLENGEPDRLYLNDGRGRFTAVDWNSGRFLNEAGQPSGPLFDWGLSAQFHDLNGDGAPDLYVCNDFQSPDRIWINDGHGVFRALPAKALRQTSLFSMGVDFADVDRDGWVDFFVADMLSRDHARRLVQLMDRSTVSAADPMAAERPQASRNTLFRNRGNGTFAEIARFAGVEASEWSWCPVFLDVDLDGYEDLLVTTGHARDSQNADALDAVDAAKRSRRGTFIEDLRLRRMIPVLDTPNVAFRNRGDLTFEDSSTAWGFDSRRLSHGMALADLDTDGDLDVIVNCLNDGPLLLRNDSPQPRVGVRLRGLAPNTRGIGSQLRVTAPGLPVQTQEMIAGGRYLSSDDHVRTFAAGDGKAAMRVEVIWRSGRTSVVEGVAANSTLEIVEPSDAPIGNRTNAIAPAAPWFSDASERLRHVHTEDPADDFSRQRLLPRRVSSDGPGISWFDFNDDGWPDLMIGAGRGGRLAVFRNDRSGGFIPQRAALLQTPAPEGLGAVLGWHPTAGETALLMGLPPSASTRSNTVVARQFDLVTGATNEFTAASPGGAPVLAFADIDGDGYLDAFLGAGPLPARFPEAGTSRILRGGKGPLASDATATWSDAVARLGIVRGAVFTDIDLDGDPDLVVTCDWGPLTIFENDRGRLKPSAWPVDVSIPGKPGVERVAPGGLTGLWQGVASGDFDNDGRPDLVVANWGRNIRDARHLAKPLELHFADGDGDGMLDLIESYVDASTNQRVPARDWKTLSSVFPSLRDQFTNYTAFASASLEAVLSAGLPPVRSVKARFPDSMLLLNRGDHWEARPLPSEAQFSPAFGVAVGDLDGDGNEDVFLAQNFFGIASTESRHDAGTGLWLRGDGRGGFRAVGPAESGIQIDGEGRGVALADYDHDGRLDLAVAQYRGSTRLYRNERAGPGLRLHLRGSGVNPDAIGARVRWVGSDGSLGPLHEVQAGTGYRSQSGAGLILTAPKAMAAVEVRWPGGQTSRFTVSPGLKELEAVAP